MMTKRSGSILVTPSKSLLRATACKTVGSRRRSFLFLLYSEKKRLAIFVLPFWGKAAGKNSLPHLLHPLLHVCYNIFNRPKICRPSGKERIDP